eukprot:CAMPEP_0194161216 /NCGR_PEP_ID=MMETSP0152-20130528/78818_1 /TAXON_ID=1049557 /ORGANISM="Thalassiothrix antarctica, Strain L6-D1" /LENGTH=91 /DNA_ID=CAMNT_0038870983 /DNA_START=664 /DNA_END=936 /DNA_ORIENTATION=-
MRIQERIIACLFVITLKNDDMIEKVIQMKFVEYTLDALNENNLEDIYFSELSCKFLVNLTKNDTAKACIREKDGTLILAKIENLYRKKCND